MSQQFVATTREMAVVAILAFIVSAIAAWPIYKALLALKSRQPVSEFVQEHAHKQGTPTMGGIITGVGFLGACLYLFTFLQPLTEAAGGAPHIAIPLLYLGFAIIGFVDDFVVPRLMKGKRGLGWTQKLVMQIGFATVAAWMLGPSPSLLQLGVTVFLILFFSNAYNFADGLDWLAGLLLIAMVAGYTILAVDAWASGAAIYLVALAASSIPFLVLNKPKAKIFMGDVGALPIGAVLGCLVSVIAMPLLAPALKDYSVGPETLHQVMLPLPVGIIPGLIIVSLMMVVELVPVPLQILSVKLRGGKRLFPMTPIHHAYQKKGWPETKVVAAFVLWQLFFSFLGVMIEQSLFVFDGKSKKATALEHIRSQMDSQRIYR